MKKYPLWLTGLLIISLICSFGMVLFDIGLIPPIFGEAENADAINRLMLNISYSYLASIVFALITGLLPAFVSSRSALVKSQSSLKAIHHDLTWCYGALSFIDSTYTARNASNTTDLKYVKVELIDPQVDAILGNINVTEKRYYAKVEYHCINCSNIKIEYIDAVTDIYRALNKITENILRLKSNAYFYQLSDKTVDLIDRISMNTHTLMHFASLLKQSVSKNLIIAQNFSYENYSCLDELIELLSKIILDKNEISRKTFSELTDEDIALYQRYLSTQEDHGDLYRQLDLVERIYDENRRI
jgi:hypothetical protein